MYIYSDGLFHFKSFPLNETCIENKDFKNVAHIYIFPRELFWRLEMFVRKSVSFPYKAVLSYKCWIRAKWVSCNTSCLQVFSEAPWEVLRNCCYLCLVYLEQWRYFLIYWFAAIMTSWGFMEILKYKKKLCMGHHELNHIR